MTHGRGSDLGLAIALGLMLALSAGVIARDDVLIKQAQTRLVAGQFYLSASVDFDFSETALEALDHGVPLTIVFHVQVRRSDAWLWEDSLLDQQLRYAIRYKPLSERFEVYRLPGTKGRDFVTRDAAIRALGEFVDLELVPLDTLKPDTDYEVGIKVFLDVEELPLPLRPMAYLKPSWKLSSGWSQWPLTP
ncbi:DUF4390 domain-containing protein [Thiocystis violacea]|uniref:DUF4390 domain-containing protein n=1 Tax=Thiocystis violacea TaxID=13725 RepID=UPI001905F168|nr:DUF4390 domain-containing protein [Thiocystis violacea]MBK1718218.1 hypothetical protein [Thiocystis violacea]